ILYKWFCPLSFCFFFFQAEDGIRDFHVTGVQTCALPICSYVRSEKNETYYDAENVQIDEVYYHVLEDQAAALNRYRAGEFDILRSEERRVGKECRSRWARHH